MQIDRLARRTRARGTNEDAYRVFSPFFFQAMTQERRRYGFVLERQCSLAKHYVSFHEVALAALHPAVDQWREVAATREYLPQTVEDMFASRLRVSDTMNTCIFPRRGFPLSNLGRFFVTNVSVYTRKEKKLEFPRLTRCARSLFSKSRSGQRTRRTVVRS